ncbi:MAG: OmpA family protein [Gammaproteobacteria bacterium]|nr:OmpA family protein [Gammaproteobacteria bacterium]NNK98132.1 OmpA family protein [Xanthomonadales bacterium]
MKLLRNRVSLVMLMVVLSACTATPKKDLALERVRDELNNLKSNTELAGYAPLALGEAERALRNAELATGDDLYRSYLVYMADRRIQIARTMAEREQHEQILDELESDHSAMLIKASQLEADQARMEAERARLLVATTSEDAQRAREETEAALRKEAEAARAAELSAEEAEQARRLAESRASEAEFARREADLASQQIDSLTRQLENLQLRQTESGVVVTLGDVLFASGEAQLVEGGRSSLEEVVDLLQTEPEKKIRVEGHTDSLGDAAANLLLSEQRAQSVLEALVSLGVASERITATGMGEDFPIASNDDEEGRARNRRVDVILLDN